MNQIIDFLASPGFALGRKILLVAFILLTAFTLAGILNILMRRKFEHMMQKRDEPGHVPDTTKFVVLRRLTSLVIYIIGTGIVIYIVPEFRALSYSIWAGAGVLALLFGFAAQSVFANILGGVFLAVSQPIRMGDRIKVGDLEGKVEDITLRHVNIRTWDNIHILIPNKIVNEEKVTNYSIEGEEMIHTMEIGISYDSSIELARKIITEEIQKHPDYIVYSTVNAQMLDPDEKLKIRVIEAGDFAIKLRAYFWAKSKIIGFKMGCDILENVKRRFDAEGVEIPFPHMTLLQKKDLKHPKKYKLPKTMQ